MQKMSGWNEGEQFIPTLSYNILRAGVLVHFPDTSWFRGFPYEEAGDGNTGSDCAHGSMCQLHPDR